MQLFLFILILFSFDSKAAIPIKFDELVKYIQPAPDQAETNSCWFVASTGAMELLLNKRDKIENPDYGAKNDLSESFLMWQKNFADPNDPETHFLEHMVLRFNFGEAVHDHDWPFVQDMTVWDRHPNFAGLPRIKVPHVATQLLFSRGGKWDVGVLTSKDLTAIKNALIKYKSPIIINYNDNNYWHVILIVGYDDKLKGDCYEIEPQKCNDKGSFYVRDSNGSRYETRAYNWFLHKGNAAAVIRLKEPIASTN